MSQKSTLSQNGLPEFNAPFVGDKQIRVGGNQQEPLTLVAMFYFHSWSQNDSEFQLLECPQDRTLDVLGLQFPSAPGSIPNGQGRGVL